MGVGKHPRAEGVAPLKRSELDHLLDLEERGELPLRDYIEVVRELAAPELGELMPRRVVAPSGSYPFEGFAAILASDAAGENGKARRFKSDAYCEALRRILALYRTPCYAISPGLFSALWMSAPPTDLCVGDLPDSRRCGVISLPRGALVGSLGIDVGWVSWAFMKAHEYEQCKIAQGEDGLIIISHEAEGIRRCHMTVSDMASRIADRENPPIVNVEPDRPMQTTEADGEMPSRIAAFVANCLLLMDSRADVVEAGGIERKPKKGKPALYRPQYIGKGYKIKKGTRGPQGGTHASPRLHWRRGHWRIQPYGSKDLPSYRRQWIDSCLVGEGEG